MQVPNDAKSGTINAMPQMENLGLLGIQSFLERYLMAHLKGIAHIFLLFISFIISKCHIALKTALVVPFLKWKN